jgi:hypothetical protein
LTCGGKTIIQKKEKTFHFVQNLFQLILKFISPLPSSLIDLISMVAPRGVTPEDEALFKTIRAEFCRRITAEGMFIYTFLMFFLCFFFFYYFNNFPFNPFFFPPTFPHQLGCHTQIRAVESDGDDYTMYIVAQGISWTVKFELTEEKTVDLFTIEKTKKKKSCTIL